MTSRPTVPDAIFTHPRLAALYDAFDGPRGGLPRRGEQEWAVDTGAVIRDVVFITQRGA